VLEDDVEEPRIVLNMLAKVSFLIAEYKKRNLTGLLRHCHPEIQDLPISETVSSHPPIVGSSRFKTSEMRADTVTLPYEAPGTIDEVASDSDSCSSANCQCMVGSVT
jgi:hypothetical protein